MMLLTNYLLVVGMGCMSRPEDQTGFVLMQPNVAGDAYQQCRYLRMDGLECFLLEALNTRYKSTSDRPNHHLISMIIGIDAHCLPDIFSPIRTADDQTDPPKFAYQPVRSVDVQSGVEAPPW